jgi:anti-sigma-K factor RskA
MNNLHVLEDIPAYVLEALSEAERSSVEKHLSGCEECRRELLAYQHVIDSLPKAVPMQTPPLRLRAAILQKASHANKETAPSFKERITNWLRPFATPAWGGVSLVLIVMLGVSNLFFVQQSWQVRPPQTEFRLVKMVGEKSTGDASGIIVISGDGNFGTLIVDGLPVLDSARQYQLWLIKNGTRTSGGVFSVLDNSYGVLVVNSPESLSIYDGFGVTIEPVGGSLGPTGSKVLGGSI